MTNQHRTRAWRVAGCLLACLLHATASAQAWEDPLHALSIDAPAGWSAMDAALLAKANAGVNHVTGRGFLGGFSAYPADTLVFPYLLVQFKPYDALDESFRPVAKLDTTGRLELITRVTRAFRTRLPLEPGTGLRAFRAQATTDSAELLALTDDGRFDFVGTIPLEDGSADIRYHSHGVIGRDGIAIVTLFADERFGEMGRVIEGPMRTLAFAQGARYADLPDEPPTPEPEPESQPDEEPDQPTPEPDEPAAAKPQAPAPPEPANAQAPPTDEQLAEQARPGDTGTLMIVLGALGLVILVVAVVVALVTHRQAQARRERARARRERLGRAGK